MDIWSSEEYFRHYSKIYIKAKRLNDEYMRRELLSRRVNRMLKRITHYFYYLVTKTMNISGMLILESRRRAKNFTILDLGGGAGDNYYTLRKFLNYSNIV